MKRAKCGEQPKSKPDVSAATLAFISLRTTWASSACGKYSRGTGSGIGREAGKPGVVPRSPGRFGSRLGVRLGQLHWQSDDIASVACGCFALLRRVMFTTFGGHWDQSSVWRSSFARFPGDLSRPYILTQVDLPVASQNMRLSTVTKQPRTAATLPPEIWHLILNSSSWTKDELRNLRLSSKQLLQAATLRLFDSVLLRPNVDSLNRARRLARAPHLACHVQTLYVRCDAVPGCIENAEDFRQEVKCSVVPEEYKEQLYVEAERFMPRMTQMQKKQRAYDKIPVFKAVTTLCERLPNLTRLNFRSEPDPSSEWSKQYGVEFDAGFCLLFEKQLQLCHDIRPVSMAFGQVEWGYFCDNPCLSWHRLQLTGLSGLKHLDFRLEIWPAPTSIYRVERLSKFLAAAAGVEELCLGFELGCSRIGEAYRAAMAVLLQSTWPQLRKLQLRLMSARFEHLSGFLHRHRKTLQDLTLDNFLFDDLEGEYPEGGKDVTSSLVVNMIVALRENFQLKKFHIENFFGSPRIELFTAEQQCSQGSRLWLIQQFVCHTSAFPFPGAARSFGHPQWCEYDSLDALREAKPPLPFQIWAKLHGVSALFNGPGDILGAYGDSSWRLCPSDVNCLELLDELEDDDEEDDWDDEQSDDGYEHAISASELRE